MRNGIASIFFRTIAVLTLIATAAVAAAPTVINQSKISDEKGEFEGSLAPDDVFGWSVASIGDLDENGTLEVAVGAPRDDDGDTDAGALWILSLNAKGHVVREQKISSREGDFEGLLDFGDEFGASVTVVGDLNEDGIADLAVGAPYTNDRFAEAGAVWILFMERDGTVKDEQRISAIAGDFDGTLGAGDRFGSAVAGIGDLSGDGIPDLAVGAPGDDDGGTDKGAVWILSLRKDGTVKDEQRISAKAGQFEGNLDSGDAFGTSVAALGDVNEDGIVDLAVGTPLDDDGSGANVGAVWILFLYRDGKVFREKKISETAGGLNVELTGGDLFGWAVTGLGDIDRDGVPDLAVGLPFDDNGSGDDNGAAFVLLLKRDGTVKNRQKISQTAGGFTADLSPKDRFGTSLAAIGDLDENGVGDLLIGSPLDDDGSGLDTGAVYVVFLTGTPPECGDPNGDAAVSSTDALLALRAAVGAATCELCVCDVDSSGKISAADSLRLLNVAVGASEELTCAFCP